MATVIALDFETSGYAATAACAIGMVRIVDGSITDSFYSLIRPPSSRIFFTNVHGLTWKVLKDAPTFSDLWPDIHAFSYGSDFFLAHNAPFDRRILLACCAAWTACLPQQPFLCTLKGCRKVLKLESYSLDAVCSHFSIPLSHHHAASDARACAQIYQLLCCNGAKQEHMLLAQK